MNNNTAGFKHYFDPEPSSTQSNPDTIDEQSQVQDWVPVQRSGKGASATKLFASACKCSISFSMSEEVRSNDQVVDHSGRELEPGL